MPALTPTDTKDLTIQVNAVTNSIIVRGPAKRQEQLAATLKQLVGQLPMPDKPLAQVHVVKPAVAAKLSPVITTMLPTLQILAGQGTDRLLVWATPKDHVRLDELIQGFENQMGAGDDRVMKVYELADVASTEAPPCWTRQWASSSIRRCPSRDGWSSGPMRSSTNWCKACSMS